MFAHKVAALLKPNALPEFNILMERKTVPWLRKQEGFLDLITLAIPNRGEVATISFWDHEANADTHNTCGYPDLVETLGELLGGAPYVKTFEVVSSTLQQGIRVPPSGTDHLPETGPAELPCRAKMREQPSAISRRPSAISLQTFVIPTPERMRGAEESRF
jgi:hypothetical protein